jgi:AraC-like DNA-binding protein
MDVLSDVLAAVRLNGAVFFDIDAGTPWVGESPPSSVIAPSIMPGAEHLIMFHLVMSGSCWAALGSGDDQQAVRLAPGDVVVFPNGHQNVMSSSPGARGEPNMSIYHRPVDQPLPFYLRHGSEGPERTRFVCSFLGCDSRPFNPLLSALPDMICARNPEGGGWVVDLFRVALAEADRRRAGTETVLAKLSELMFVEVLRRHIETLPADSRGWLSGLRDKHVGEALKLIHGRPSRAWTLDELAHDVGLSRTTFADRFVHYVGMPPMQYLARWRMQLAARKLENPGVSIAEVAAEVGYESEAAFNRAFKKLIGVPPGSWRRSKVTAPN